jgi:adenine-specific DNA methylase
LPPMRELLHWTTSKSLGAARAAVLAALLVLQPPLRAAQLNAEAEQEINALLQAVGGSGCQFFRGGSVYPAARAQEHLTNKYATIAARGLLASTEEFIDKTATRSSLTGQAYVIQCPEAAAQTSGDWMRAKLDAMRQRPSR